MYNTTKLLIYFNLYFNQNIRILHSLILNKLNMLLALDHHFFMLGCRRFFSETTCVATKLARWFGIYDIYLNVLKKKSSYKKIFI